MRQPRRLSGRSRSQAESGWQRSLLAQVQLQLQLPNPSQYRQADGQFVALCFCMATTAQARGTMNRHVMQSRDNSSPTRLVSGSNMPTMTINLIIKQQPVIFYSGLSSCSAPRWQWPLASRTRQRSQFVESLQQISQSSAVVTCLLQVYPTRSY